MRRDDRDDPFEDIFRELERMMNEMMGGMGGVGDVPIDSETGFGDDVHVAVYEDDDIRVVADLAGIRKESLDLKCDGEVLTISAAGDRREYEERIRLPAPVDEHSASATYNNGILEVTFERADASTSIDL